MSMPKKNKKIAIVLGSHRSGTSLLAAGLESLGAHLGLNKIRESDENQKGFFENKDVVQFNDRLLLFFGGHWDNPLFDGTEAISAIAESELEPWLDEAKEIFQSNFNDREFVAIKDPRMCQLLLFWTKVIEQSGVAANDIYYVHIARHPLEVAQSQRKRKLSNPVFYSIGENIFETVSLWFSLSYQSLRDVNSSNNIFVMYEDLLNNPDAQLERLARFLGLSYPSVNAEYFCDSFVDKALRHNIAEDSELLMLKNKFPEALELFEKQKELSLMAEFSRKDVEGILSLWPNHEFKMSFLKPITSLISNLISERLTLAFVKADLSSQIDNISIDCENRIKEILADRENRIKELSADRENIRKELESIKASLSWRITAFLRLFTLIKRLLKLDYRDWVKVRNNLSVVNRVMTVKMPLFQKIVSFIAMPVVKKVDKIIRGHFVSKATRQQIDTQGCRNAFYQQDTKKEFVMPLVTVIVPNYNHAEYLRERLDSIYSQSYCNIEVVLMDDASTDESLEILQEYSLKHPDITRLVANKINSGGVFYQWESGLSHANGEIVWIAESDDFCDKDFLEETVKCFSDQSVMFSYCKTVFVGGNKGDQIWSMEEYLHDIDTELWKAPFASTAHNIVNRAWAIKNIVPNVSSAVFRNPKNIELMHDESWKNMKICGDWVFYLHIIRGGVVAYTTNTNNYYRIHDSNTSVSTYSKDVYYKEHECVARCVNQLYKVHEDVFVRQKENIKQHWIKNRPSFSDADLERCYSLKRIEDAKSLRKPNLLMAGFAFAAGGGETFPIQLANLMKSSAYSVLFMNCDREPEEHGVREMLRGDIPVVYNFFILQKIIVDFGIEVIHSHHAWVDNNILDLIPEDYPLKYVVSLHGMYETIPKNEVNKIIPRLVRRVDKLVYTAEKNIDAVNRLDCFNDKKFVNIGNALETYEINPFDLKELGIADDAFVLCLVSRAIPDKGWKEAVESVELARQISGVDVQLLLIGEGMEYDYFIKKGCPAYVHLLGFRKNIRDYYASSDMGYLPSRFKGESFPLTVIDCLNSGKPVLASDVGEIPNMLDAQGELAGCLFSLNDWSIPVRDVAKIIARCATDKEFYNKQKKMVPIAANKFNPVVMRDKYDEVYTSAVSAGKDVEVT